jgi:hypothetical protein
MVTQRDFAEGLGNASLVLATGLCSLALLGGVVSLALLGTAWITTGSQPSSHDILFAVGLVVFSRVGDALLPFLDSWLHPEREGELRQSERR